MKHYHIVSRIAIYLLSVVLVVFGIIHFTNPRDLLVFVPPSLPGGITWVYVLGSVFILCGLSFLTNQFVKFTGYLLAVLLLTYILVIHLPNYKQAGDPEARHLAMVNMLKDLAIMGFALHIAAGAHHQHFHLEEAD